MHKINFFFYFFTFLKWVSTHFTTLDFTTVGERLLWTPRGSNLNNLKSHFFGVNSPLILYQFGWGNKKQTCQVVVISKDDWKYLQALNRCSGVSIAECGISQKKVCLSVYCGCCSQNPRQLRNYWVYGIWKMGKLKT